jgi:hypothetical protein
LEDLDDVVLLGFLIILINPRRLDKFGIVVRIILEMKLRVRQL